jgi:radical SAM protein with 4Fe4S-binding SPASM domain
VSYAKDKGFNNHILPSLLMTRKQAKQIAELGAEVLVHIDTINQDDYNKVHNNPKTLHQKIQGYKYLLEEGVPPDRCWVCITFTKAAAAHIEETIDWYADEMKVKWINLAVFKTEGFGSPDQDFEPGKSDLERALKYRAEKFKDETTLRFGTSDAGTDLCRTYFVIKYDGRVTPCPMLSDLSVGNVFTENVKEIYEKHKDELTFNFKVKGYCGEKCPDRDICFGCRAIAYHYARDVKASDPKCWRNPDNPEYVFGF